MRVRLDVATVAAIAMLSCAACSEQTGAGEAQAAAQTERVTAVGCPAAGPQPGCVTIVARGKTYDISGASPAVDLAGGRGVSLTGQVAEAGACGVKLSDIRYDYLGLQCGSATPPPT